MKDRNAQANPLVSASVEVVEHASRQHAEACSDRDGFCLRCPCGVAVAGCCAACGRIIFLTLPGAALGLGACVHAKQVRDSMRVGMNYAVGAESVGWVSCAVSEGVAP